MGLIPPDGTDMVQQASKAPRMLITERDVEWRKQQLHRGVWAPPHLRRRCLKVPVKTSPPVPENKVPPPPAVGLCRPPTLAGLRHLNLCESHP